MCVSTLNCYKNPLKINEFFLCITPYNVKLYYNSINHHFYHTIAFQSEVFYFIQ